MKRLEDRIYDHLRREAGPVGAVELARQFLGAGSTGTAAAGRIVDTALSRDPRFQRDAGGWIAVQAVPAVSPLAESRWFLLAGETRPLGTGKVQLVAVVEQDPGQAQPAASHGFVLGSHREVQEVLPALSASRIPVFQAATEFQLLRFLDELFQRDGVFLRALHSRPLAEYLQLAEATGSALPELLISLPDLLRLVLPAGTAPTAEALFTHFQAETRHDEPLLTELAAFPGLVPRLVEQLALRGTERRDELGAVIEELHRPLDFSRYQFTRRDLEALPDTPGVYRFYDDAGRLIYTGKSIRLRRRVQSYFRWAAPDDPKLSRIQSQTARLAFTRFGSDLEALLEDAELILTHRPPINIQLDIHDRPQEKPAKDPLIVLMPHAEEDRVQLFLLHPAGSIARLALECGRPDLVALDRFLDAGAEHNRLFTAATGYHPEVYPLALRWLRKNSHQLTYFRYHDFPNRAAVVQAVAQAIREGAHRSKVVYR